MCNHLIMCVICNTIDLTLLVIFNLSYRDYSPDIFSICDFLYS